MSEIKKKSIHDSLSIQVSLGSKRWEDAEVLPPSEDTPHIQVVGQTIGRLLTPGIFRGEMKPEGRAQLLKVRPDNFSAFYVPTPEGPKLGTIDL